MKIGFLFSGQGSQAVGMGKSFYESSPETRDLFDRAETALGIPIKRHMFEGPEETLTRTDVTQPAICLVSLAAFALAKSRGISAAAACGHSLGEYAALSAAGAIDPLEAVRVVAARGRAMQDAADRAPGKMAAVVGLAPDAVRAALAGMSGVGIAAHNAPDQVVLSGESHAVDSAVEKMKSAGAKNSIVLKTSGAWHSHLMEPAKDPLRRALAGAISPGAAMPVIANATAEPFPGADGAATAELLVRQLTSPIRFVECIQRMRDIGVDTFVELGPGKVLRGLVKKFDRAVAAHHIEDMASFEETVKAVTA